MGTHLEMDVVLLASEGHVRCMNDFCSPLNKHRWKSYRAIPDLEPQPSPWLNIGTIPAQKRRAVF
jgi:hypothetical protein